MQLTHLISKTLMLALLGTTITVSASELESAVRAAKQPRSCAELDLLTPVFDLFNHRFNVYPLQSAWQRKDTYVSVGRLVRLNGTGGADDSITYCITKFITKEQVLITDVTWRVNGGDWTSLSEPIIQALKNRRAGGGLTPEQYLEQQSTVKNALEKALDTTWQKAAEILIGNIAMDDC